MDTIIVEGVVSDWRGEEGMASAIVFKVKDSTQSWFGGTEAVSLADISYRKSFLSHVFRAFRGNLKGVKLKMVLYK